MIELITGIVPVIMGGIITVFKHVFLTKQKDLDNKKDIALTKLEIKHAELEIQQSIKEAEAYKLAQAMISDSNNLIASYKHDSSFKPSQMIENLRASVRPVGAYCFMVAIIIKGLFYPDFTVNDPIYQIGMTVITWWYSERRIEEKMKSQSND